jgi:hypothetical protein
VLIICVHCQQEQPHPLAEVIHRLDRLEQLVKREGVRMSQETDAVRDAVAEETAVVAAIGGKVDAAVAAIADLKTKIGAAGLSDEEKAELLAAADAAHANVTALTSAGDELDAADAEPTV